MAESLFSSGKLILVGDSYIFVPLRIPDVRLATCGGGGISPTFGAALWVIDYTLQAVLNNVDRLYFHQGTIGNCVSSRPPLSAPLGPF